MPFAAVLFDLDGTLLDTIEDLADAMNATLAEAGLPTHPLAEHKFMVGDGVRNYLLRALPAFKRGDDELFARLVAEYRAAYAVGWANKTRPYDGITEMLAALRHLGLRLAVLSNKPDDFSRAMVAHYFEADLFEIVRGALPEAALKPDPAAALRIAEQMGLSPSDYLYVGDTATDMKTAVAAGMHAVGVLWGFRPRAELETAGAQTIIARPEELLTLL